MLKILATWTALTMLASLMFLGCASPVEDEIAPLEQQQHAAWFFCGAGSEPQLFNVRLSTGWSFGGTCVEFSCGNWNAPQQGSTHYKLPSFMINNVRSFKVGTGAGLQMGLGAAEFANPWDWFGAGARVGAYHRAEVGTMACGRWQ